ncbi:MAG TPA: hypothetical protein VHF89_04550 [Solirubrobacteraceae bacterium]|nr:hypothetical protein [Solirubrobacteraceae bacterium]
MRGVMVVRRVRGAAARRVRGAAAARSVRGATVLRRPRGAAAAMAVLAASAASVGAVESAFTARAGAMSEFAAAAVFQPRSLTPPAVSGDAAVGATLTASTGTWARAPQRFAYRWVRCAPACAPIPNEDQQRYLVTGDDAGATLKVEVTATNDGGSAAATSAPTAAIVRATYTHVLCADPAVGSGVGEGGVLPEGLTFGAIGTGVADPTPSARCDTGAPVIALSGAATQTVPSLGDAGWLQYKPPADVAALSGELYRHGAVLGGWGWWIEGSSDLCRAANGCSQRGDQNDRFAPENRVATTGAFRAVLACDRTTCDPNAEHVLRLFGGRVTLRDTATPRVTTPPTGSLVADATLGGTESMTFSATDAGAGLYRVRATVDGTTIATRTLDGCVELTAYVFAEQRPCASTHANRTVSFDTTTWPRPGRLRVYLEDAGRNTTTLLNRAL